MGSELRVNGLEMKGTISSNFIPICVIPKVESPMVEENNVRRFLQSSDLTFDRRSSSIWRPVTPDFDRPSAEQSLDMPCQAMLVSSPSSVHCSEAKDNGSKTPKESIFDPFAPVHDKFTLAPRRRKCVEELRNNIVRRLNFSSTRTPNLVSWNQEAYSDTISEEEQVLHVVYSDLLDVIASEWTKEFASKSLSHVSNSDGFCTPNFAARLTGIAETCPGAPKKSMKTSRSVIEICLMLTQIRVFVSRYLRISLKSYHHVSIFHWTVLFCILFTPFVFAEWQLNVRQLLTSTMMAS